MLVALKKDGYLIFSARFSYLGDYWYVDQLEELEKLGRIKAVDQEAFFKYDNLMGGIGKFTKTPTKVFVYRKTEGDSIMIQHQLKKLSSMTASTDNSDMYAWEFNHTFTDRFHQIWALTGLHIYLHFLQIGINLIKIENRLLIIIWKNLN